MHLPMEMLTGMTTRTDSGTKGFDAPRSREVSNANAKRFDKVFEKELTRHDTKVQNQSKTSKGYKSYAERNATAGRADNAAVKKKFDELSDTSEEALAAGVENPEKRDEGYQKGNMGNQEQGIVTILEGEESVATPAVRTETTDLPETNQTEQNTGTQPVTDEPKSFSDIFKANTEDTGSQQTVHALNTETAAKAQQAAETEVTDKDTKTDVTGEVTARMPEQGSQEKESNTKSDLNLKDNGNPSPLENNNDGSRVTGQNQGSKDETFAKAIDAVKSVEKTDKDKETGTTQTQQNTQPIEPPPPPLSMGIKAEMFKAQAQMAQISQNHAVAPENLFDEMISRVQTNLDAAKSTMTIQLNPEYLGKVALEVAVDAAGVHVKINAEDSNVRGMINSQLGALIESMESKGIAVSEVEVVYAGANFDNPSGRDDGRQESNSRQADTSKAKKTTGTVEYYTTITDLMDFYLATGHSSVEFCA